MSQRTIYVSDRDEPIFSRAAVLASEKRMSLSNLVATLVERWVNDQEARDPKLEKGDADHGKHDGQE